MIVAKIEKNNMKNIVEYMFESGTAIPQNLCDDEEKVDWEIVYDDGTRETENAKTKLEEYLGAGDISKSSNSYEFINYSYCDITESILLNSGEISQEALIDSGLWANFGTRKMKITFDTKIDFFEGYLDSVSVRLTLKKVQGEYFDKKSFEYCSEMKNGENAVVIDVDTNELGEIFNDDRHKDRKEVDIKGYVSVSNVNYKFPVTIKLINTNPQICEKISKKWASIDFGTSSTCVAIEATDSNQTKYELLSLSPAKKSEGKDNKETESKDNNIFENPTNIMVYNMDSLYREWKSENKDIPLIRKGDKNAYNKYKKNDDGVVYDFGHSVKELLGEVDTSREELNAILTLIKMIPYKILSEDKQIVLNPYEDADQYIDIVADPEEQDSTHLDPVAFYGYLIGRAVNDISKNRSIYTKFTITSPAMFNDDVKKATEKSLKYGLERSVPVNLRDKVELAMKHTEPVAYIAAMIPEKLKVEEKEYFAVYDFGGGTLDFSYGTATNENGEDTIIDIKGVGGKDNFGGELLIEKIAYTIYLCNHEKMKENKIPITVPMGMNIPDDMEELCIKSNIKNISARANMNIICSQFAKEIFHGEIVEEDENETRSLNLYGKDGLVPDVSLTVDVKQIEDNINSEIDDTVKAFRNEIEKMFVDDKGLGKKELHIFMAGNASRYAHVKKSIEAEFEDCKFKKAKSVKIEFVDDTTNEEGKSNLRYAISPKTAVAIGQLKISQFTVNGEDVKFRYYVGFINSGTGEFKTKLDKNDEMMTWKRYRKITGENMTIDYKSSLSSTDKSSLPITLPSDCDKSESIYIRIKSDDTIEWCCSKDEPANDVKVEELKLS